MSGVEARRGDSVYRVFDHGAHACAWGPEGGRPVLWMSSRAILDGRAAIRGGVPVCFPWFGGGPSGTMKPAHGFARLATWRLASVADSVEREGRLVVDYRLDERMVAPQPDFPHRFEAGLRVEFARDYLQIDLEVKNTGDKEFAFEEALHSYLAVGDVRRVHVEGLDGASYLDKAPGAPAPLAMQTGPIEIVGETDRVYLSSGSVSVVDPALGRRLVVTKGGSAQTVVWNPWVAKSKAMADFGDDEWMGMICVEAVNALDHAARVSPGASHRMWQRIAVAPL
ncbi:MAG: D-hexose-6-phosphate mutarotase [Rhodoblastus sp.]|nr:MAG: D-hexose-6-phosphate mutarotase [Rhodoblastus sp.]